MHVLYDKLKFLSPIQRNGLVCGHVYLSCIIAPVLDRVLYRVQHCF